MNENNKQNAKRYSTDQNYEYDVKRKRSRSPTYHNLKDDQDDIRCDNNQIYKSELYSKNNDYYDNDDKNNNKNSSNYFDNYNTFRTSRYNHDDNSSSNVFHFNSNRKNDYHKNNFSNNYYNNNNKLYNYERIDNIDQHRYASSNSLKQNNYYMDHDRNSNSNECFNYKNNNNNNNRKKQSRYLRADDRMNNKINFKYHILKISNLIKERKLHNLKDDSESKKNSVETISPEYSRESIRTK